MTYRRSERRKPASRHRISKRREKPKTPSPIINIGYRPRALSKLQTIDETAELLNVSRRTVRRLIDSGALPKHHVGRSVRISDADIAAFLAANRSV